MGRQMKRLGQADSDFWLSFFFTTRGPSKLPNYPKSAFLENYSKSVFLGPLVFLVLYPSLWGIIRTVLARPVQIYHFWKFSPPGGAQNWGKLPKICISGLSEVFWLEKISAKTCKFLTNAIHSQNYPKNHGQPLEARNFSPKLVPAIQIQMMTKNG